MEMNLSNGFLAIENDELNLINGGVVDLNFIGSAFKDIYNCGKDFGYNVMGAVLKKRR